LSAPGTNRQCCRLLSFGDFGVPLLLVDAVLFWKSGSSFLLLFRGIIRGIFSFAFRSDTVLQHLFLCRIESVVVPVENLPRNELQTACFAPNGRIVILS